MIAADPSIRLDRIAEVFAAERQAERGIRQTSVAADVNAFKRFESIVRQHGACSMDQVTEGHIEKYSQANIDYALTTQRNRVLAVRRVLDAVCKQLTSRDKQQVVRVIALLDAHLAPEASRVKYGIASAETRDVNYGIFKGNLGYIKGSPTAPPHDLIENAIHEAFDLPIPDKPDPDCARHEWGSVLFELARHIRSNPDLWPLTSAQGLAIVERVRGPASEWCGRYGLGADEAREQFLDDWDDVRTRKGHGLIQTALLDANARPLHLPEDKRRSNSYQDFITVVGWMQVARGNRVVALPQDKLSGILCAGNPMRMSRYIRWAIEHRFLKRVSFGSKQARRADKYWFDVSRFKELSECAARGTAASFANAEHIERRLGRRNKA